MTYNFEIFIQAAHRASVIPFGNDIIFYAMKSFGTYPMMTAAVLSTIGATLGYIFNWYLGRSLIYFKYKGKLAVSSVNYERARAWAQRYGVYLLVFSWVPLCNVLLVAAGFLKLPLRQTIAYATIGVAWHYGNILLG